MKLITNRTPQDVERWRTLRNKGWCNMTSTEKREWLGEITLTPSASKGMYTHNDLNRVEQAVSVIAAKLRTMGLLQEELVVKTDWSYKDGFWVDDMERYLGNIRILRNTGVIFDTTPVVPSITRKMDYSLANDIEKILMDINDNINKLQSSKFYVGELMSGEV